MDDDPLARELAAIVGEAHVLTAADQRSSFETDWTRRFSGTARLVVRPGSTGEVAAVVRACVAAGAAVLPQGGNTGLVGGSVPRGGEVVVSLLRLTELGAVDTLAGQVTAGAGVTLAALRDHVGASGFAFGVDLAARGSCTIGGMVATNAGGLHVLRYGGMRQQVAGIEAVLPDGSVVSRMTGLGKDNSGYDLAGLLAGSEGTLGIVTRVVLRLIAQTPAKATALLALPGVESALELAVSLRRLPSLDAIEVFFEEGLSLVCEHTGIARPIPGEHGCYLLAECAAQDDPSGAFADVLAACEAIEGSAFATDRAQRDALWRYREAHTESVNAAGIPHKLDVTLPLVRLAEFERQVRAAVEAAAPGTRCILFGHLGDGNLHVNLLGPAPEDERADEAVFRLVASMGGSISAEHGIGVAKAPWLHLTRSPADLAAMRAIKRALDPAGLFNPGVIFESEAKST